MTCRKAAELSASNARDCRPSLPQLPKRPQRVFLQRKPSHSLPHNPQPRHITSQPRGPRPSNSDINSKQRLPRETLKKGAESHMAGIVPCPSRDMFGAPSLLPPPPPNARRRGNCASMLTQGAVVGGRVEGVLASHFRWRWCGLRRCVARGIGGVASSPGE